MPGSVTDPSRTRLPFGLLGAAQISLVGALTLVVVPLPAIQHDFALTPAELALLSAAYGLAFAGLLLVGGRVADLWGARRTFLAGLTGFGASSLLGLAATTHPMLLGVRFAQGATAALVAPAALALVARLYPDASRRARALATWGTLSVTGAVGGTVVSGLIAAAGSWRLAFLPPAMVAAAVLAGTHRLPSGSPVGGGRLRLGDGALVTAGLVAVSYGLLEAALLVLAAGLLLLAGFLVRQARTAEPLLPLQLVTHRWRAVALLVVWLTAAAHATIMFLLSLFFQQVQGRTQVLTSLAFLPFLLVIAMGPVAARVLPRYGVRGPTVLGLLLTAAAAALLSRIEAGTAYGGVVLAGMVLFAVGSGLAFAGATVTALDRVPDEHSGVAGGVVNTALQTGPTVGLALLLALASARTGVLLDTGQAPAAATTGGYATAFAAAAAALAMVAAAAGFTLTRTETGR